MLAAGATLACVWVMLGPEPVRPARSRGRFAPRNSPFNSSTVADTTPDELIARAAERDPFSDGSAAIVPSSTTAPPTSGDDQPLRVLGTVVDSAGGSFALCQLGTTQPVVVRVGQRIGDYELRRVEKAGALFATRHGGRIERRIPKAGE
jgi:hypothetical protein